VLAFDPGQHIIEIVIVDDKLDRICVVVAQSREAIDGELRESFQGRVCGRPVDPNLLRKISSPVIVFLTVACARESKPDCGVFWREK
jgi:hypothetical protein